MAGLAVLTATMWLVVDGVLGPATHAAHAKCAKSGGYTSPHFRFSEFRTKNPSLLLGPANPVIRLNRDLVMVLEVLRAVYGPISVISGFRDTLWNRLVGGARNSQHLFGNACDMAASLGIKPYAAWSAGGRGLGQIGGGDGGTIVHVDVREFLFAVGL